MIYQNDMSKVDSWGDQVPEGWYKVRVDKVKCVDDAGNQLLSDSSHEPLVHVFLKIQNEPYVGRVLWDAPSLQPHALAKLKAYYEAVGYTPGPEGHDPERLKDGELFVKVDHDTYQGAKRTKIAPYNIKSLQEGPKGPLVSA
jgi:hypothetical protein